MLASMASTMRHIAAALWVARRYCCPKAAMTSSVTPVTRAVLSPSRTQIGTGQS